MIELRGLSKTYGERAVITCLDLHMAPGETVAIEGPSGSGKTTLLRLIAGLERPDAGNIFLGGRCMGPRDSPHLRGIAFLFQSSALWPHMSVSENIEFGLAHLSRAQRRMRSDWLLERVGLKGFAKRRPASLSGGEARRVALARALAPQLPILLLDEPTSNLNDDLREHILDVVAEERAAHGLTVLLVTHVPADADRLADRRLALRGGRLIASCDT